MNSPAAIYRHYAKDGALLYVGVTSAPKRRLAQHKSSSPWAGEIHSVTVQWLPTREAALEAEANAIEREGPIFNGGPRRYMPTGDAFRDWMASSGMTQADLAEATGCARSLISQMASGQRRTRLRFAVMVEDMSEGAVPVRYWLKGVTASDEPEAPVRRPTPTTQEAGQ